jgi:hypothetical protein
MNWKRRLDDCAGEARSSITPPRRGAAAGAVDQEGSSGMRFRYVAVVVALVGFALGSRTAADDAPATVAAVKENVAFTVDATGVFDATAPVEVAAKLQVFGDEIELEFCAGGGPVEKGAVLVRFKTEKIDEAIRNAERDLGIAKATLATQTEDQRRQIETTAAALAKAEFEAKAAQEMLDRFEKTDMPLRLEESTHGVEGTRNWVSDQTEELAQLEKMYKADDLVEATEEIVLNRAKRDLARARKSLDFHERRDALLRGSDLPREHEGLRLEARRTAAERDRAVAVNALQQAQAKLELDRTRAGVETQEKQFAKLTADREKFVVVAPAAGVAVPGAFSRGKWQNIDDMKKALKAGGKFHSGDVLLTIVQPGPARVLATVPEAAINALKVGQAAQVVPNAAGDEVLDATLAYGVIAASGADFEVGIDVAKPDPRIFPGMGCRVRVATGSRAAIMVPAGAIEDGFEKAVYVLVDGKPQRRPVRVGATLDGKVEIVSGLAGGERVIEAAPKK